MPREAPNWELQKATFERLNEDLYDKNGNRPGMDGVPKPRDGGVPVALYDVVPDDAEPPYIEFADSRFTSGDTKDSTSWVGGIRLEGWSTYQGSKEANELLTRITESLTRDDLDIHMPDRFRTIHLGFDDSLVEKAQTQEGTVYRLVVRQRLSVFGQ